MNPDMNLPMDSSRKSRRDFFERIHHLFVRILILFMRILHHLMMIMIEKWTEIYQDF